MTTDLTTRVTELAALIGNRLNEAERTAHALAYACRIPDKRPDFTACGGPAAEAYWEHFTPYRQLDHVKATRSLIAAILAETHDWNPLDEYYSCSQARENTGTLGLEVGPPGSGCSDPDRAGQPCDCGRDQRVARLLGIIASEWEVPA